MASRRKARILAFQALYAWEASGQDKASFFDFSWVEKEKLERLGEDGLAFARLIFTGTVENIEVIDGLIQKRLEHWDFSRLQKVDLAILRLSVYSLLFQQDIPAAIVIEEAIGLCLEFSGEESRRFINGVLDAVRRDVESGTAKEAV